jgi:hypothetical protein
MEREEHRAGRRVFAPPSLRAECDTLSYRGEMNDDIKALREAGNRPLVVHPGPPLSIDDLLRNIDPAPDDETERFVAAIYADRREAAGHSSPE